MSKENTKKFTHYGSVSQISFLCDYNFTPPTYGETTTDPSFYEPQATRIANMRKSASGGQALYDFEDGHIPDNNIDNVHIMLGRKPGLTLEEVSQIQETNAQHIVAQSEKAKKDEKAKEDSLNEQLEIIQKSINASRDTSLDE